MRAGHHDKLPTHPLTKGKAMEQSAHDIYENANRFEHTRIIIQEYKAGHITACDALNQIEELSDYHWRQSR
jgi:hypothetical protein